jgi:hypothetical protein
LHFCANLLGQSYSIGSVPGATSYVWTTPTGSTGSSTNNNISLLFNPSFQNGVLSVTTQNNCGQSSPASIIIAQHLPSNTTLNVSTCNPYTFDGQTYAQSGTYSYLGSTIWGCDSVVVLNLTIHNTSTMTQTESACGSYSWNGQSYFNSGFYSDTLQTSSGCDSIINLDLTVHPIVSQSFDTTVLDLFVWNGIEYATSGTYTQFFSSIHGCDSSVTYNVTIEDSGLNNNIPTTLKLSPNPIGVGQAMQIIGLKATLTYEIINQEGKVVQFGQTNGQILLNKELERGAYFLKIAAQSLPLLIAL